MERLTPATRVRATLLYLFFTASMIFPQEFHELQRGETLYRLSRKYGVSVEALMAANGISDVTDLAVGMKLKIPGSGTNASSSTYQVQPGDTLYGIARSHGLTVDGLLTLNGLKSDHLLLVGEELRVAEGGSVVAVAPDAEETEARTTAGTENQNGEANSPYFWPHEGVRMPLNGKLLGKEITAAEGDPVLSVTSGKVIWVAPYHGYGKIVMVESPDKHIFAYGGNADTLVNVGDFVRPGQKIGLTGSAGRDDLPKVYFFVYKNGKPVDPDLAPRK